jgi:hypothetical protein
MSQDAGDGAPAGDDARLFAGIAALYEKELRIPAQNVCNLRCDARFKAPLLPWHIGGEYQRDPLRLVIVGRPHRQDDPAVPRPSGTLDGRRTAGERFASSPWAFWRYTREILGRVHGSPETGWSRIAMTTIVKCATALGVSESDDRTTRTMKLCCLGEVGVLQKELEILAPRTVVLYTGRDYDAWVPALGWSLRQRWRDLTHPAHVVQCGGVPLHWWEGEISGDGHPIRVLRVDHPHGKPLDAYAGLVSDWILRGR